MYVVEAGKPNYYICPWTCYKRSRLEYKTQRSTYDKELLAIVKALEEWQPELWLTFMCYQYDR
jgi:hypothetical protein